jgi:hypothetical protein
MLAATMMLKVVHPDDVREKAVARAKELGGFPTLVTDAELHLKLPPDALMPMIDTSAARARSSRSRSSATTARKKSRSWRPNSAASARFSNGCARFSMTAPCRRHSRSNGA